VQLAKCEFTPRLLFALVGLTGLCHDLASPRNDFDAIHDLRSRLACANAGFFWWLYAEQKVDCMSNEVVESPFERGDLKHYLELSRERDIGVFISCWLLAGSDLRPEEISKLRYSDFDHRGRKISYRTGNRVEFEAELAPVAAEAIVPFLIETGPQLLLPRAWKRSLDIMLTLAGADIAELRRWLKPTPAHRSDRRAPKAPEPKPSAAARSLLTEDAEIPEPPPLRNETSEAEDVEKPAALQIEPREPSEPGEPSEAPSLPKARKPEFAIEAHMKVKKAAVLIDKSERWIKNEIRAGHLKGRIIGGEWVLVVSSLSDYLARCSVGEKEAL
jgi:hypothetical protein